MDEEDTFLGLGLGDQTEWIERQAFPELGFRVWHVMLLCFSSLLAIVILVCCCIKFRIPRTKQEIEADFQRKKIAQKFRERLRFIQNSDMDNMDLKLALERVQTDFDNETKKLMDLKKRGNMVAEPQPYDVESATNKISVLMSLTARNNQSTSEPQNEDAITKC